MNLLKRGNPLCIKSDYALKLSQWLFFFVYGAYLLFLTLANTTYKYEHSTKYLSYGAWICCFLALFSIIFLCRYSVGQLIGILLFLGIYFIIWIQTQQQEFISLQSLIIVFSCRNVDWDHLLRFSFIFYIILILIPALLEQIGLVPVVELFRGTERRYTLGFSHPNVLGGYCLCFILIWLLLRYKNLKFYDYIIWILMATFLWFVPNSKSSTFLVIAICLLTFIFKHWGKTLISNTVIQSIALSFGWLMAGFSIAASYFYNGSNDLYVAIDKTIFTTRLSCAHTFFDEYPITFFGQRLTLVSGVQAANTGTQSHILDNFYVRQLLNSGIVSLILVLAIFTYLLYRALKTRNYALLIGLLVMLMYCVYEYRGFNILYDFLLFQIVYQFEGKERNRYDSCISDSPGL